MQPALHLAAPAIVFGDLLDINHPRWQSPGDELHLPRLPGETHGEKDQGNAFGGGKEDDLPAEIRLTLW